MTRYCQNCGRRLRTGIKWCYECKSAGVRGDGGSAMATIIAEPIVEIYRDMFDSFRRARTQERIFVPLFILFLIIVSIKFKNYSLTMALFVIGFFGYILIILIQKNKQMGKKVNYFERFIGVIIMLSVSIVCFFIIWKLFGLGYGVISWLVSLIITSYIANKIISKREASDNL